MLFFFVFGTPLILLGRSCWQLWVGVFVVSFVLELTNKLSGATIVTGELLIGIKNHTIESTTSLFKVRPDPNMYTFLKQVSGLEGNSERKTTSTLWASLWMKFLILWQQVPRPKDIPKKMEQKEVPNQTY